MTRITRAPVADGDVMGHVALAATTYPDASPSDPTHFRWKHLANPCGASIAITLEGAGPGDPMRGHVFVQRRTWVGPRGTEHAAGLITDLVLAPDARDARSFMALMADARTPAGVDLILHTSNETSDALYRRLLRYPVAFELKAYGAPTGRLRLRVGEGIRGRVVGTAASAAGMAMGWAARLASPVLRRLAGVRISAAAPPDTVINDALDRFRRAAGPHLRRDPEFLAWRFGASPDASDMRWVRLRDGTVGYVALAVVQVGELRAMGIQDVALSRAPRRLEGWALRTTIAAQASRAGAGVVLGLWNPGAELSRWMTGLPFIAVPDGLLPHGSPIFPSAADGLVTDEGDLASAYLALGDLDYF